MLVKDRVQDKILSQIINRIVGEFSPKEIYLFGSRARGEEGTASDYDILVVMHEKSARSYRLSQQAYRKLRGIPVSVDILFTDRESFEAKKHIANTIARVAASEGKKLYAA